eukprot:9467392-Pyramimonas_sp.AAC.1
MGGDRDSMRKTLFRAKQRRGIACMWIPHRCPCCGYRSANTPSEGPIATWQTLSSYLVVTA